MALKLELFSSPACGKCDQMKKKLQAVADQSEGRIEFTVVNILQEMDYALQLGVLSTPCIAVNGNLLTLGLPDMDELKKILDEHLAGGIG